MKKPNRNFKKRVLVALIATTSLAAAENALSSPVTSAATNPVTGHEPTLSKGEINYDDNNGNGKLDVGDTVKIKTAGLFSDPDGDDAIDPTYEWLADGDVIGGEDKYVITSAELGKVITLRVRPHTDPSVTEPADGVATLYDGELSVVGEGELMAVTISGSPIVSGTLTAAATCIDSSGGEAACEDGAVSYQWQLENGVGSGSFFDIAGATDKTYQPTKTDQKKKIQVVVTEQ